MGVLVQIAQLLLSLALLILVHELGHFLAARAFRTRIDKFYLFFNPWFSVFRAKRIDGRWQLSWFSSAPPKEWETHPDSTEWGLGWLPLGGYCKIAGMIDESMDTDAMKKPPQPWEYRSKPAWQRFFIITGGVLVNFITALAIYAMVLFAWGQAYIPVGNATYGYDFCQVALDNGFENGDRILLVNGETPERLRDVTNAVLYTKQAAVTVLRDDDTISLVLPSNFARQIVASKERRPFAAERAPFVVDSVMDGSPAHAANLQSGDSIVSFNGHNILSFMQITDSLKASANQLVVLGFYRNGELILQEITPNNDGQILVTRRIAGSFLEIKRIEYGFFASISAGIKFGTEKLVDYVRSFRFVFTREGAGSLGGFGTIAGMFTQMWDWVRFWEITAFLSIILAFMNILPIPALDGGHMILILYEMITRRKPNDRFMERVQMVGIYLLIALMVYANGNDLLKWIGRFF